MKRTLFLLLLALPCMACANIQKVGEALVTKYWTDVKGQRLKKIHSYMSLNFRSVHYDGKRNANEELQLIKNFPTSLFQLSSFTVAQRGKCLFISYYIHAVQSFQGGLIDLQTVMLDTYRKEGKVWKIVTHETPLF